VEGAGGVAGPVDGATLAAGGVAGVTGVGFPPPQPAAMRKTAATKARARRSDKQFRMRSFLV